MYTVSENMRDYLQPGKYIDFETDIVSQKAKQLKLDCLDRINLIEQTYTFVRDEIKHSWDAQDKRVTVTASDVLREGVGICFAKANLLAALLRANEIPAGICYQRLTLGDTPDTGYCVHALNAVFVEDIMRWVRLDARGNKTGVCAGFSLEQEYLAFTVRREYCEIDYPEIYAEPIPITMEVLEKSMDALDLYLYGLPDKLPQII